MTLELSPSGVASKITEVKEKFLQQIDLFLILQLIGQPVEALVKAIAAGGARRLDVPVALAQRMQAELVCDLSGVHGIRQILYASNKIALNLQFCTLEAHKE